MIAAALRCLKPWLILAVVNDPKVNIFGTAIGDKLREVLAKVGVRMSDNRDYWIIEKLFMMRKDEDYVLSRGYSREEIEEAKEWYHNGGLPFV